MNLSVLDDETIGSYWPVIARHIEASSSDELEGPGLEDIRREVSAGSMLVVAGIDGTDLQLLATLGMTSSEQGRTITVHTLTGSDIAGVIGQLTQLVDEMARQEKATTIVVRGRAGWAKLLKGEGYREIYRVLVKHPGAH